MNYLLLCSKMLRHYVSSDAPIKMGEKCKCFSSCPNKDKCEQFKTGEFVIRSCGSVPKAVNPISLVKNGDIWQEGASQASSQPAKPAQNVAAQPAKPAQNAAPARPTFGFTPSQNIEPAKPVAEPANPAQPARPTFGFTPSQNAAPAPEASAQPINNPAPARPTFGFTPSQNDEPAPASEPVASTGFPTRNNEPVASTGFPTRNSSIEPTNSAFPSRSDTPSSSSGFPTRNPAPSNNTGAVPGRFSAPQSNSQSSGGSFSDRFINTFNKPTQTVSVTQGVTINDFKEIRLGGVTYTDGFILNRQMAGKTLTLIRLFDEIRSFWQVSFVFKDNHTLRKEFIWLLLKLNVLPNKTKEEKLAKLLEDTIYENPEADKNSKFFYLIHLVTPPNQLNGFYISDQTTFRSRLAPLFTNVQQYINKFFERGEAGQTFRQTIQNHLPEVMYYLGYTEEWPNRDNRETFRQRLLEKQASLFDDFVIRHYETTGRLVSLNRDMTNLSVEEIGNFDSFIQNMAFPQPLDVSRKMVNFLKRLRFTPEGSLLARDINHPLPESNAPKFEGSVVYEALELPDSSLYLEEYNLYCTLLQEYIDTFKPESVSINGVLYISKGGFISEVKEIVLYACEAALCHDLPSREKYISKALLLYSLLQRGVLHTYVATNQSQKQYDLYLGLLEKLSDSSLKIEDYVNVFQKEAVFYIDGASLSQHDYFLRALESWQLNEITERMKTNDILSTFIRHDLKLAKDIDARVAAYEKVFASLK